PATTLFLLNDTSTLEICTLSLHDALPIFGMGHVHPCVAGKPCVKNNPGPRKYVKPTSDRSGPPASWSSPACVFAQPRNTPAPATDRKSTRLNSSHVKISYAVFCLKKKIKE